MERDVGSIRERKRLNMGQGRRIRRGTFWVRITIRGRLVFHTGDASQITLPRHILAYITVKLFGADSLSCQLLLWYPTVVLFWSDQSILILSNSNYRAVRSSLRETTASHMEANNRSGHRGVKRMMLFTPPDGSHLHSGARRQQQTSRCSSSAFTVMSGKKKMI